MSIKTTNIKTNHNWAKTTLSPKKNDNKIKLINKETNDRIPLINTFAQTILLVLPGAVFNNANSVPSEEIAVAEAVFEDESIISAINPQNAYVIE